MVFLIRLKGLYYLFLYKLLLPVYRWKWRYHRKHDKFFDPCFMCPYGYKHPSYQGYCTDKCPQMCEYVDGSYFTEL